MSHGQSRREISSSSDVTLERSSEQFTKLIHYRFIIVYSLFSEMSLSFVPYRPHASVSWTLHGMTAAAPREQTAISPLHTLPPGAELRYTDPPHSGLLVCLHGAGRVGEARSNGGLDG